MNQSLFEEQTESCGTGTDAATRSAGSSASRQKTADGLVFQWLGAPAPDGLGLSRNEVSMAGRLLKGRGNPWTPWGIGALLAALHGTAREPVLMARKIAKGVVPDWACVEARKILKRFEEECGA